MSIALAFQLCQEKTFETGRLDRMVNLGSIRLRQQGASIYYPSRFLPAGQKSGRIIDRKVCRASTSRTDVRIATIIAADAESAPLHGNAPIVGAGLPRR